MLDNSTLTSNVSNCGIDLSQAELPLILLPTFIFNVIAFIVIIRMKGSSETLDRLLVSSLIINDLISTVLYIATFLVGWLSCGAALRTKSVCAAMGWMTATMVMWSAGVITVMTSCRYLAVVKPLYYRMKVTSKSIKIAMVVTLVFFAIHTIFPLLNVTPPYRVYSSNFICGYEFTPAVGGLFHKIILGLLGAEGILVILLVLFCNASIIYQLRKKNKVHSDHTSTLPKQHHGIQRRTAFAKVTIVVSFVFCLCYGPYSVRILYDVIINANGQNSSYHSVTISLLFLSPLLNPVLYGAFNRNFRECFSLMIKRACRKLMCKGDNPKGIATTITSITARKQTVRNTQNK